MIVNYQLNRAHSLGYAVGDELDASARAVRRLDDCAEVFTSLAERAEAEG